ncbi:MAG: DinB family protein [Phycisphaerales bacterium]
MPASNPVEILLAHNHWATRNILDACTKLSDAELDKPFEMGVGSLRATMTHLLGALRGWGDLLADREQRERLEKSGPYSPVQLLELLDEIAADVLESAESHPVDEIVTGERAGKTYSFTRGAVLTHVTTHGMHHRAQALNMLRRLGVDPLPPSSVMEWVFMVDNNR